MITKQDIHLHLAKKAITSRFSPIYKLEKNYRLSRYLSYLFNQAKTAQEVAQLRVILKRYLARYKIIVDPGISNQHLINTFKNHVLN